MYTPVSVAVFALLIAGCGGGGGNDGTGSAGGGDSSGGGGIIRPSRTSFPAVGPNGAITGITGISQRADVIYRANGTVASFMRNPMDHGSTELSLVFDDERSIEAIGIITPSASGGWRPGDVECDAGRCAGQYGTSATAWNQVAIMDPVAMGWNYQTFGIWLRSESSTQGFVTTLSAGFRTPIAAAPTRGSATYTGNSAGMHTNASGQILSHAASLTATADFSARTLQFATSGTQVMDMAGTLSSAPDLDLRGSLICASPCLAFFGDVRTSAMQGTTVGFLYGANAEEIGGIYDLRGVTSERMVGGFGGKR